MLDLKVPSVVGILQDEVDLIVYVMKIENAPLDSYADNGGLEAQSHDIKEAVELLLTHPEFYANIDSDLLFLILLNHGSLKIINHHAVFKWSHKTETYSQLYFISTLGVARIFHYKDFDVRRCNCIKSFALLSNYMSIKSFALLSNYMSTDVQHGRMFHYRASDISPIRRAHSTSWNTS
ncbi:hypothetical protein Bca4012_089987 [Brassica carinata]